MTQKRFIFDGLYVRDILNEIPSILTHNDEQRDKFLDGLNKLNNENQAVKDIINELNSMGFYRDSALLDEYLGKIARAVGCEWE